MSVYSGPEISNDGLVLCLDAANLKSYNPNLMTTLGAFNYSFNNQSLPTELDVAPDGSTVLCRHNLTGAASPFMNARADRTLTPGVYTMSAWVRATTAFSASFAYVGETTNEIYSNTASVTTSWTRFTLTFTLAAQQTASRLQIFFGTQGNDKIISVWGAELVRGSASTPYYINNNNRGVTWYDITNTNTSTLTNSPSYSSANLGAIMFDGVDDFVDYGNPSVVNFGDGNFTVGAWFYRNSNATTNLRLLSKGAGADVASEAGFALFGGNTSLAFVVNPSGVRPAGIAISISLATPTYVTATVERGGLMKLYKNGVFISSASTPTGSFTGAANLCIGCNSTAAGSRNVFWDGGVYNVHLYNRAITAAEVAQNYAAQRGRFGV